MIRIKMGDIVPADVRILKYCTTDDPVVKIDQSDLTGESLPVTKSRRGDCAYSGSNCQKGEILSLLEFVPDIGMRQLPTLLKSSNQVLSRPTWKFRQIQNNQFTL